MLGEKLKNMKIVKENSNTCAQYVSGTNIWFVINIPITIQDFYFCLSNLFKRTEN